MCGEVQVPEHHLEVCVITRKNYTTTLTKRFNLLQSCRVCDAQGKQCRSLGEGAGAGIKDADFVFYVSAMDTGNVNALNSAHILPPTSTRNTTFFLLTERCQKGMTVAYAAHCQQEVSLDR